MSRRYLLDTNAVSDLFNDRRGVVEKARTTRQAGGTIGTCVPAVGELFYGAENSTNRTVNLQLLRRELPRIRVWPFDRKAAEEFGRLRALLRRTGRQIGVIDAQIAAIALTIGCTVVTLDSDFSAVPGLTVENWAA